jgi:hypothetical protein
MNVSVLVIEKCSSRLDARKEGESYKWCVYCVRACEHMHDAHASVCRCVAEMVFARDTGLLAADRYRKRAHVYIYACMYLFIYVCVCIYIYIYVYICIYIYICIYVYVYVYVYMYIYICIFTWTFARRVLWRWMEFGQTCGLHVYVDSCK